MKKLLFIAFFAAFASAVSAQKIEFETLEVNYGTVVHGANGVREFKFKNTGKAPLLISNAQGSCGCTVPTWPKEPIMPGASAVISVSYDTKRQGEFDKKVTLTTNSTDNTTTILTIKGNVLPAVAPVEAPQPKSN